jgi:hypothetical protein
MFRLVVAILAIVGVVSLVSGGVAAAGVGLGVLLLPLLFVAKFVFFMMLFGAFGRMFWHKRQRFDGSASPDWWGKRPTYRSVPAEQTSPEEDFEDWHRMAHAKKEVESWTDGMPGTDENA